VTPPAHVDRQAFKQLCTIISGETGRRGRDPTPVEDSWQSSQADELMLQLTEADSKLLVFKGSIAGEEVSVLLDSGASAQFMSERLAKELAIPLIEKKIGTDVQVADGRIVPSEHIARVIPLVPFRK
jgi:predicted aspartyl protease